MEANYAKNARMATTFVEGLTLPAPPRRTRARRPQASQPRNVFEETRNQSLVVGSNIVSFVTGVSPELRGDILNCSLLAQLAANRHAPSREDIRAWYEIYFDTLSKIGWVTQDRGFSEHRQQGENFETQKAILSVAASVFGPAATALVIVESTLNAMKSMSNGPWLTIFNRESQTAKAARFQVTVAEPESTAGAAISLMAFELAATSTLTQVLFFKFRSTDVTLRHASGRVAVDANLLKAIRPTITAKVAAFTHHFVDQLEI